MEVITAPSMPAATRRAHGRYYTPPFIARRMFAACLRAAHRDSDQHGDQPLRILDPACGDGSFLIAAFDRLARNITSAEQRLAIVRDSLFGVDTDAAALELLRAKLVDRVSPTGSISNACRHIVEKNIRLGDALTGPGFAASEAVPTSSANHATQFSAALDFGQTFPEVGQAGGFDLVIGNPPYRRELNARSLFDHIATSEFGRRWKQARMDLWYYFLHRGLDLVKPGGRVSYIVNSYWTASTGARLLIERLESETSFEEVVLLGDAPVFPGVAGQHMIFRLQRGCTDGRCRVIDLASNRRSNELAGQDRRHTPDSGNLRLLKQRSTVNHLARSEMFYSGRLVLQSTERWLNDIRSRCTLGECFEIRQGMAENPPFLTQKGARELGPTFRAGQGVFVLTHDEIDSLGFDAHERALLRPYYSAASIDRFYVPPTTDQFVLYLSSRSVNDIDEYPNIARHLTRFRPLLDRRREVRSGKIQWWELHWPREERIFRNPRILAPQMGRQPRFALAELPTYVGFSTNVVVSSREVELSLTSLTGILNSQLAARWFARHAKRRGVNLEINGSALRQFPLPARNEQNEQILADLIVRRQSLAGQLNLSDKREEAARLDRTIDDVVCRLYGVDLNCVCQ